MNVGAFDPAKIDEFLTELRVAVRNNRQKNLEPIRRLHTWGVRFRRKDWEALALHLMGDMHRNRSQHDKALDAYARSRSILEQTGDRDKLAAVWNSTGTAYWYMGDLDRALEAYVNASQLLDGGSDQIVLGDVVNNMGIIHGVRREFESALEHFHRSLKIRRTSGDETGVSDSLLNLGSALEDRGDFDNALEQYQEAISVIEWIDDPRRMIYALTSMGNLLRRIERLDEATDCLTRALEMARTENDRYGVACALLHLARTLRASDDQPTAKARLIECRQLARRIKAADLERDACLELAGIFESERRYKSALNMHKRLTELLLSLSDATARKRVTELQARFNNEQKVRETSFLREKNRELGDKQQEIERQRAALTEVNQNLQIKNRELEASVEALQKAQDELLHYERMQSILALAVTANHEMNQPLMILSGNLDLLAYSFESAPASLQQERCLNRMRDSLARIRDILGKMSTLDLVEFGEYSGSSRMVALNPGETRIIGGANEEVSDK
jgi:tetratricopeptide (TPR) repeat protein